MWIAFVGLSGSGGAGAGPQSKHGGALPGLPRFPNKAGSIEIFWRADGWCWWSRGPGRPPEGAPIGPFLTSTEAYLNASGGAMLIPRPEPLPNYW